MKARVLYVLVALMMLMMLMSLCSCASVAKVNTFTLYVSEAEYCWQTVIERFKAENEGVEVEVVSFETNEALETRLANELATGGGPDVVLWNLDTSSLDMRKLAMNGNFMPLDEYFAADETFKPENYYQPVLDSGKIGGVQYTVPVAFNVPLVMCRQSTYDTAGIGEMESISMQDFCRIIADEREALRGQEGRYPLAISNFSATMFYAYSGLIEFDYAAKTVTVDREMFRAFMEQYRTLNDAIDSAAVLYENIRNVQELVKYCSYVYSTSAMTGSMCWTLTAAEPYGELPAYFHFGTYDGTGSTAISTLELAINKNSQNPDLAYRFIRSVMDGPAVQMMEYEYENTASSSVSRGASAIYYGITIPNYLGQNYSKYMYPQIVDSLETTTDCAYISIDVRLILQEAFAEYLTGEADFDTCFDRMMNKLTLYITE